MSSGFAFAGDLAAQPRSVRARRALIAAVAVAAILGLAAGHASAPNAPEPALVNLVRFMAVIKLAMAAAAAWLLHWRLARPAAGAATAGAILAVCAMAAAPGLIWGMAHVLLAAALFHAGLLALLAMAWSDKGRDVIGRTARL